MVHVYDVIIPANFTSAFNVFQIIKLPMNFMCECDGIAMAAMYRIAPIALPTWNWGATGVWRSNKIHKFLFAIFLMHWLPLISVIFIFAFSSTTFMGISRIFILLQKKKFNLRSLHKYAEGGYWQVNKPLCNNNIIDAGIEMVTVKQ